MSQGKFWNESRKVRRGRAPLESAETWSPRDQATGPVVRDHGFVPTWLGRGVTATPMSAKPDQLVADGVRQGRSTLHAAPQRQYSAGASESTELADVATVSTMRLQNSGALTGRGRLACMGCRPLDPDRPAPSRLWRRSRISAFPAEADSRRDEQRTAEGEPRVPEDQTPVGFERPDLLR